MGILPYRSLKKIPVVFQKSLSFISYNQVSAEGNKKSNLTVTIKFENKYDKPVLAYFSLGGFENFGMVDSKGNKYKIHTSSQLIGTNTINEGYKSISRVSFGNSQLEDFTYLQDTLKPGESKNLIFTINKVDTTLPNIKEISITCKPKVNFVYQASKLYLIENIKINWINK